MRKLSENKHLNPLLKLLYVLLAVLGLWIFFQFLLPCLLPFLIALLLAWILERPVQLLIRRLHFRRTPAAALCTLLLILLLCGALGLLLWRTGYELALLLGRLPLLLAGLPTLGNHLEDWSYRFIVALPVQFQDFFQEALSSLIRQGISLPNRFYESLAGLITGFAAALPNIGLFLFTTALATFFSSASRPRLLAFLKKQLPSALREKLDDIQSVLRGALGGWLKAQGILMLVTFVELTVGFFLLQVDLALLIAALVALVDALPVFGTGTVLIPWAVFSLVSGNWKLAIGLIAVYGVVSLVRSLLEPKLVGEKAGLPPLAALFAMYLGFQAFGVAGMILSPLAAIFLKQLHDSGLIHLWRK